MEWATWEPTGFVLRAKGREDFCVLMDLKWEWEWDGMGRDGMD
jgi:hypothetical protein